MSLRPTAPRVFRPARGVALLLGLPAVAHAAEPVATSTAWLISSATILTLLLVGWIALIWWLRGIILGRLKLMAVAKTRQIASQSLRRLSVRRLLQLARIGARLGSAALIFGGLFLWATLLLDLLPATHPFALQLEHRLFGEIQHLVLNLIGVVPGLGMVALIYFVTRILHEMLNHYFRSIADGEVPSTLFDEVTAETTRRLADIGIWVAAIIIAFPYIPGSDSAAFRGVTVLAGLMLSLGSANLVGQFASGLSLIYGRAVRPGECIECGAIYGVVEHIGLFACTIRTSRNEIVVLPHTTVAAGLKNFSRQASLVRLATTVTIGYDAPWRQVRSLLLAAAEATPGLRADPAPAVRQAGLEDFYVTYELLFTPEHPAERNAVLGRLHEAIQDQFQAAGVQIMSPHYEADPAAPKIPPGRPGA